MTIKKHLLLALGLCAVNTTIAQDVKIDTLFAKPKGLTDQGIYPKKALSALEGFQIDGYYRFIANYRQMEETYAHIANNKNNIFVGDDSQIPQLMLNIKGFASANTFFGTDLFLWTPMTGAGQPENVKGLNLGISMYGTFGTEIGNFTVRAGGINWYMMSPFTFQSNKGYNRYSIYERNPWDPVTAKIDSRYEDFYSSGAINQDQRWGNQAFQGLILEGENMPGNTSMSFMYGKTQFEGGFSALPNQSIGGRFKKAFKNTVDFVAFNTFNNYTFADSLLRNQIGFNIATLETNKHFGKFNFYGEFGIGRKFTDLAKTNWGEAISLKLSTLSSSKFPLELHAYRVSPNVFNNSSIFINSSFQQGVQLNNDVLTQPVLIPVASAMLPIGQITNNRQGIELNGQFNFGKFKNSIGYSVAQEMESLTPKITYGHAANNLALSRFWRWDFPANVGPYNNLSKIYRAVFETLYITDVDPVTGLPANKKSFNTIEINSKYKANIGRKNLYLFYLGSFNSVQDFTSPMVVFSEKAYVRGYYHQIESYYKLNSRVIWNNYFGHERIIANYQTQTDVVSKRPKNQTGYSYATGFDIALSKGFGLYIRQRWMNYKDSSFALDKYKGFETTVELKLFF